MSFEYLNTHPELPGGFYSLTRKQQIELLAYASVVSEEHENRMSEMKNKRNNQAPSMNRNPHKYARR